LSKSKHLDEYINKKYMECKNCKKSSSRTFCSTKCYNEYRKKEAAQKHAAALDVLQVENEDYVICKWCGGKVKRIYGTHIKNHHPGKTVNDYKKEFPGSLLTCNNDKQATSKNAGQHMKSDKYRKMASDAVKGEKNPNHRSKTTEDIRKERSPFSVSFYTKKGIDTDSAKEEVKKFAKKALCNRITDTQLKYWINKCNGNITEAKKMYSERQSTFTLKKCILRYGRKDGETIFYKRQTEWKNKVFNKTTCISTGTSKLSNEIAEKLSLLYDTILFGKHEKFIYDKHENRRLKYDITLAEKRKIIEVNGVFWHCKPGIYESTYYHKIKNKTAKEIWKFDEYKTNVAKQHNYSVHIVWEDDYKKDPEGTIKKCIDFLNE